MQALPPILVVDDDASSRLLIKGFLAKVGVVNPIIVAADGEEAIAALTAAARGETALPALALLDINMPTTSGIEVLRWMRKELALATTPVVMLTGTADDEEIRTCYDLGVASFLVKPVGFAALGDVLRDLGFRWAIIAPPPEAPAP